ncbi:hypothetical protein PHPALM_30650 [Phytophthora palmivora]|uniref:Uncharacterized protein n=1 Tax=Phytophthora palmivora TaxID=4796 RepID=A0A2P4X4N0_9STRA|nr:hypothetical protein PHPALM_30650 [Phytophthora palmivora]
MNTVDDPNATNTVTTEAATNEPSAAVTLTDNPDDFDALESEAESDDGASDSTRSLLGDEYTPAEDVRVEEVEENLEEPMFDEALLGSMGGIANVASGTIHGDILKNMGVSG